MGQCTQYGDDSTEKTYGYMRGGGLGVLMLKRSEPNSCCARAKEVPLWKDGVTQRGGEKPTVVLDN